MDPFIAAAIRIVADQRNAYAALIADASDDALTWRPGPETNSVAVLVTHGWGAARAWCTRGAKGTEIERDRSAEFAVGSGRTDLTSLVERSAAEIDDVLRQMSPADLGAERTVPGSTERHTAAYCILHAIEHAQEHLGQAALTLQLHRQSAA